MEPTITADVIYNLVVKLKGDGLNDAEIKKALVNSVMTEQQVLQTLNKEAIFLHKKGKSRFRRRSVLYTVFAAGLIYFMLYPFLSEKAAGFVFLTLALGISTFLVIKIRTLLA